MSVASVLVECKELMSGGIHAGESNNDDFSFEQLYKLRGKDGKGFLCPIGVGKMSV